MLEWLQWVAGVGDEYDTMLMINRCGGSAKVRFRNFTAIEPTMPVLVGIFTPQILQDTHLTDTRAERKQSTPLTLPIPR